MSSVGERLRARTSLDAATGCLNWTGSRDRRGYGRITMQPGGRKTYPHRVAYELAVGPIPPGLVIDHLCRNPSCCNPEHLEAVTSAENTRRGRSCALKAPLTHCPAGHAYDAENTRINARGHKICRACRNAEDRSRPRRTSKARTAQEPKSDSDGGH